MAGELADHRFDAGQVALAYRVQCVRIGREQPQAMGVIARLQRHQPRMQVFGVQFAFETLETAPPQVTHGKSSTTARSAFARGGPESLAAESGLFDTDIHMD